MPALPPRLSLEQVRRLAKDLLRDLKDGDRAAIRRLAVVSAPSTLAGAQLAIAREYDSPAGRASSATSSCARSSTRSMWAACAPPFD